MDRHIAQVELSAFADGELSPSRGTAIQEHLDRCPACSRLLASFESLDESLCAGNECVAARPLISAFADGELGSRERPRLVRHLAVCVACQQLAESDRLLDARLAALPREAPSARVDAAIAAIVAAEERLPRRVGGLPLGALLRLATVATVSFALLLTIATLGGLVPSEPQPTEAVLAAAQQVVFDAHTNTLYVLEPKTGILTVLNGTTHAQQTQIVVGGRPTALALNAYANTILVLDGTEKRLTEIDTARNAVLSAASLDVAGTPTSLQVDTQGQIVVASVVGPAAGSTARPTSATAVATGQVTVLDGTSKQVKTVRSVDIAPQAVSLDPTGRRALLVSAMTTTVADASSYRPIEQLPGGVAAVFDSSGSRIAVLTIEAPSTAKLLFFGDAAVAPLRLAGTPLALLALPDGGFAALLNSGGAGHVAVIDAGGQVEAILDAPLTGRDLAYDAATRRFAIVGDSGVSYPLLTAQTPIAENSPTATPTPTVQPSSPRPSSNPSPAPAAPVALPSPSPIPTAISGPARFAALAWSGTYRLSLPDGRKPVQIAGAGARLWFTDQFKGFGSVDTQTGKVSISGQLPADWNYGPIIADQRLVVALDQSHGRVAVYDTAFERFDVLSLAFVSSARAFALAPDERLWTGGPGGTLLAVDLSTKRLSSVDVGATAINALWVDSGGRVWYADDARKMLGSYDPATHKLSERLLPRTGNVISLVTDGAGTLWVATDAGEAIPIRPTGDGATLRIAGLLRLTVDSGGRAWYFASVDAGSALAPLTDLAGLQVAPAGLSGPAFDSAGSAWLADARGGVFYIVTNGGGRQ